MDREIKRLSFAPSVARSGTEERRAASGHGRPGTEHGCRMAAAGQRRALDAVRWRLISESPVPHSHSRALPHSLSSAGSRSHRRKAQRRQAPCSSTIASRSLHRAIAASISPIALPHSPLPPRPDCSSWRATVRANSPIPSSMGISAPWPPPR